MQRMLENGPDPSAGLDQSVRERVEEIGRDTCEEWGGTWDDGVCKPTPLDIPTDHSEKTVILSESGGVEAFERYTDYFDYVLDSRDWSGDGVVLLPCGKQKPIGSSAIHSKKVEALKEAGFHDDFDIVIISEPCTIIPHDMRLSLPAVNYDFPPEFAEEGNAPSVFEVFTDRIAEWIDATDYDTFYPYLIKRHQRKFNSALEKAGRDPRVVEIPGASLNPETMSYSGDRFKSLDDIEAKLNFIRALNDGERTLIDEYDQEVVKFYEDRDEYTYVEA